MTMLLASIDLLAAFDAGTRTLPGPAIVPVPRKLSILFFLNRKRRRLLASTVASLWASIALRSSLGAADLDAEARESVPGLLEHLRGVQQRLRRDAADVETGSAEGGALLYDGDVEPELGGLDGTDVAARPGADDGEIVGQWHTRLDRPVLPKR